MLDALNAAVARVTDIPRVQFVDGIGDVPARWLEKKHANGSVHEPATLAAMLAIGEKINVTEFYDVGALYGYFTLAAQQMFPAVKITAMEMHPALKQVLHANVNRGTHNEVECLHVVASDVCKPLVKFWINGFNIYEEPEGGWSELEHHPDAMRSRGANNQGRGWARVDFASIDAITVLTGSRPDLIKIDVEAYQQRGVMGMVETLKAYRPHVIIEVHDPIKISRLGITNKSTIEPFFELGYSAYWCQNFRDMDARFEAVTEMTEAHEMLGIMVLVP